MRAAPHPAARSPRPRARRGGILLVALVTVLGAVGLAPAGQVALGGLLGAAPAAASTADPSLAPTPYQGWNTYYGLGGDFTEQEVLEVARAMKDRGLLAAGYDIVWLDGGWTGEPYRDEQGNLRADPARFPSGLGHLVDQLHAMGFRAGIYTDAGTKNDACGVASGGGYQQRDADAFAAWGFDAVKVDFVCGFGLREDVRTRMTEMISAIRSNASGRPMVVNLCNPITSPDWGDFPEDQQSIGSWRYAPAIAESWRTYTDVGFVGQIRFADVLRNHDANAAHPEVAGPGRWSDPDYLGPELGMSDVEFRTQMSLWTISAAPLIVASDVRALSESSIAALTDPDVIAIDQDPLGEQGRRLGPAGEQEVWTRHLADGSQAVLLLNRSDRPAEVGTTTEALGLAPRVSVRDAWTDRTSEAHGTVRETVPAHGASLLRIAKATGKPGASRLSTSPPEVTAIDGTPAGPTTAPLAPAGSTLDVRVRIRNDGTQPVRDVTVAATAPAGWVVTTPRAIRRIAPGGSAEATLRITIPAGAAVGETPIPLSVRAGGAEQAAAALPVTVSPPAPRGTVDLAHHAWVSATSGWMQATIDASVGGWTPLRVAGVQHATGIGVASPSTIRYDLGAGCSRLTGSAGIDDAVAFDPNGGTARFRVIADGRTLWDSGLVRRGSAPAFDLDVTGVRDLRLVTDDGGDGGYNDRADWTDLTATCG